MTTDTTPTSLGEQLPLEINRVRDIITMYRHPMLQGMGEIAARLMEADCERAQRAMIEGDTVAMIQIYQSLKGWES